MTDPSAGRAGRRDTAREERLEILRLLENGTVTADEAERLLDALDRSHRPAPPPDDPTRPLSVGSGGRHLRIRVTDTGGRPRANVVLPIGLVDAGLSVARRFAPGMVGDPTALRDAILAGGPGPILVVDDEGDRVEITVE